MYHYQYRLLHFLLLFYQDQNNVLKSSTVMLLTALIQVAIL